MKKLISLLLLLPSVLLAQPSSGVTQIRAGDGITIAPTSGRGVVTINSTGGGGGAPTDATYVTQTPNGSLSAEQALSLLSTGIMRVATTTGVVTALTDSAGIAANISDETGTGVLVFNASPTFTGTVAGASLSLSSLATTRVPFATTAGLLTDSAAFTFNSGTGALTATTFVGALTGNASTATALQTPRNINGVAFDGSANITVTAAGSTLSDTVPVSKGGTGLTAGTSGGILAYTASGTLASSLALAANGIVTGSGAGVVPSTGSALFAGIGSAFVGGQREIYSTSTNPVGIGTTGAAVLRFYTNSTQALSFSTAQVGTFAAAVDVPTALTTPSTTFALLNTTATTVNAFGAATTVNTGAAATQIWNFGGGATASELRFLEPSGSGTNYSGLKSVAMAGNITYSFPPTAVAGGVWTDVAGNGVLTSVVPAGGAALTSTYVGYGASSVLSGEAAFIYTAASNILTVGGVSLGAGSEVSTIGPLVDSVDGTTPLHSITSAYAAGTAYSLTATSAAIDFGTTDPVVVPVNAGTYLLYGRVVLRYNGATFAANRTVTLKIRRTNNTAADVANSSSTLTTGIISGITATFLEVSFPPVLYTTANTNDSLTIFADVDVVPTAGTLDASAASLVASRQY